MDEVVDLMMNPNSSKLVRYVDPDDRTIVFRDIAEKALGRLAPSCGRAVKTGEELRASLQSFAKSMEPVPLNDDDAADIQMLCHLTHENIEENLDEVTAALEGYDAGIDEASMLASLMSGGPWKDLLKCVRQKAVACCQGETRHRKDHQKLLRYITELQGLEESTEAQIASGDVKRLSIVRGISVVLEGAAAHAGTCKPDHRDYLNFAEALRSISRYLHGKQMAMDSLIVCTLAGRRTHKDGFDQHDPSTENTEPFPAYTAEHKPNTS